MFLVTVSEFAPFVRGGAETAEEYEALGEIVFVLDSQSRQILMANNSVSEVLGFEPETVIGMQLETSNPIRPNNKVS